MGLRVASFQRLAAAGCRMFRPSGKLTTSGGWGGFAGMSGFPPRIKYGVTFFRRNDEINRIKMRLP